MKIVVFGPDKRVGLLRNESVVDCSLAVAKHLHERQNERNAADLAAVLAPADLARFIEAGPRALENVQKAVDYLFSGAANQKGLRGETVVHAAGEVTLHAPKPNGARIAMAGGNFADHAEAMYKRAAARGEKRPPFEGSARDSMRKIGMWGFWKIDREALRPEGEVMYPEHSNRFDYEGEGAIVLGKQGKDIKAGDLKSYIWGVTLVNDWSIRMRPEAGPMNFATQKNFDGCVSVGPCIVVGELDAPNLPVETLVNGQRRQNFNTSEMVFSFGEYLEFLSRDLTLYPGDIISGGTAVGTAADSSPLLQDGTPSPEWFLKPGDVVEVKSPGIGTLRNRVVAKSKSA
jgi:2-keto-4-pentenoate hydratase/2-oxohepta-3-ene-1,7-dioic acid hydratase in catechol pathway